MFPNIHISQPINELFLDSILISETAFIITSLISNLEKYVRDTPVGSRDLTICDEWNHSTKYFSIKL